MARRTATSACLLRFASLAMLATGPAAAATVYKCRDAAGHVSYQEQACPAGTEESAPVIAPPPPYVPPAPAAPVAASTPPPQDAGAHELSPPPPLPALYQCERYDGQETYITNDPVPRVYQVPLWAALPQRTGVTAGGVNVSRGMAGRGRSGSGYGAYTTVEDHCRPMGRSEMCAYWSDRGETVRKQLMTAFNDTKPQLLMEQAALRENRAAHCR